LESKALALALEIKKAKAKAEEQGASILSSLKEGVDLDQLANEKLFEWTKSENVGRDDPDVKRSVLRSVFKLGRPDGGKSLYNGFSDGMNDYIVVGVTAVNDVDTEWSGIDDAAKKTIEQLQQQRDNESWQDFLSNLKQHADIKMYSEAL